MEETFLGFRIKSVFPEATEDFPDMLLMISDVIGVDENVVEIDDHTNIEHVGKDVVHKMLECGRGVGETFRNDEPFIGAVPSPECCFPLITFRYADKMISGPEIDFGVDAGFPRCVKEIGGQGKWIPVLLRDPIQGTVIYTEAEGTIFLFDE